MLHRRTVTAFGLGLLPLALGAGRAGAASDLSLQQVIDRHVAARGGAAKLDAVRALAVDMQIVEKGEVIEARYRCDKSPAYRIDIYAGGIRKFRGRLAADHGRLMVMVESREDHGVSLVAGV